MPAKVYVASRRDLDEAVLDAVKEVLPFVAKDLPEPERPRKEVLSNREAMEFLDLSKSTLQRYRDDGTLPYSKLGGNVYYEREDLLRVVRQNRVQSEAGERAPVNGHTHS